METPAEFLALVPESLECFALRSDQREAALEGAIRDEAVELVYKLVSDQVRVWCHDGTASDDDGEVVTKERDVPADSRLQVADLRVQTARSLDVSVHHDGDVHISPLLLLGPVEVYLLGVTRPCSGIHRLALLLTGIRLSGRPGLVITPRGLGPVDAHSGHNVGEFALKTTALVRHGGRSWLFRRIRWGDDLFA